MRLLGPKGKGGETTCSARTGGKQWRRTKRVNAMASSEDQPWPTETRLHRDRSALTVAFDTGERFTFPAEYLRVRSPSAEVQGHAPDQRRTVPGKRRVRIDDVQPVGNYAVRLVFDDGHATGIFSWRYFMENGRRQQEYWRAYLDELAAKGLGRD